MRLCTNCRWSASQDGGYSNYTVLDTTWHCVLDLNQGFPAEDSGWDDESRARGANLFAQNCVRYEEGNKIQLDVDGDSTIAECCKGDPELLAAAESYFKSAAP